MNYQSIFATTPRNEEELVALEKETQQLLLKTLDINFTRKRSEKLREITCVFAGFPNGFQQIKKYWESLPPDVFCSNEDIDKLLTLPDGLIVVFSSNDEESSRVYQAIANKCIEHSVDFSDSTLGGIRKQLTSGRYQLRKYKLLGRHGSVWVDI